MGLSSPCILSPLDCGARALVLRRDRIADNELPVPVEGWGVVTVLALVLALVVMPVPGGREGMEGGRVERGE